MPRRLTPKEFAEIAHRHTRTIYRWIEEGFLKAKKVKGRYLIPVEEVERIYGS